MIKIKKGKIISHFQTKTITESDNNFFSFLTMNHHPIHINKEFAKKTRFKKILVVDKVLLVMIPKLVKWYLLRITHLLEVELI